MSDSAPRRRLSRRKKVGFAAAALLLGGSTLLAVGEFVARWHIEGSVLEAVDSILGLRTAAEPGTEQALIEDAELGFRLNPEVEGVNARGLRLAEPAVPKPAGVFRVLLLGDSVGFPLDGFFRDVETHFAARSSRRLEFVNACVHGYTTYQERVFFERDLLDLEPDLVVLQYCVNDNFRFLHRLTSKGRRLITFEAKNYLFPEGDGFWPWLSRTSYLVYSLRKLVLSSVQAGDLPWEGIGRAAWMDATWADQEEHVRSIAGSAARTGGRLVVVAFPHEAQLDPGHLDRDREHTLKPQLRLRDICARGRIPFLDLQEAFLARRDEGLFTDGLHLTDRGHRLAGRALTEFLARAKLIPLR